MSGITITPDSGTQFEAGAAEYNSIDRLGNNNYVLAYRDNGDGNKGKVNVGSRTGTSVTVNEANAVVFNSDSTDRVMVSALSATLIVIFYRDVNTDRPYVIAATISGTTITIGTAVQVVNAITQSYSIISLDSTNFVVSFNDNSAGLSSYVGSISGTTITLGAIQIPGAGFSVRYVSGARLDGTHCILFFDQVMGGGNYTLYSMVATVDVGLQTITWEPKSAGIESLYHSNSPIVISAFDNQHFIVAYQMNVVGTFSTYLNACSISPVTFVITVGSTLDSGSYGDNLSLCAITANNFILGYYTGVQAEVRSGTLSGSTTIVWDVQGAQIFDTGTSAYISLCRLTDDYFIVDYKSG